MDFLTLYEFLLWWCSRYLVFCDPPGPKIGNGGATMHVLQEMEAMLGWDYLKTGKKDEYCNYTVKIIKKFAAC